MDHDSCSLSSAESRVAGDLNMSVGVQGGLKSSYTSCIARDPIPPLEHTRKRGNAERPTPINPELREWDRSHMSARRESSTEETAPDATPPLVSRDSPMPLSEDATVPATHLEEMYNGTHDELEPADVRTQGVLRCESPWEGPSANTAAPAQHLQYNSPGKKVGPRKGTSCPICDEAFGVTRKMVLHMMKQHGVSPHTCRLPAMADPELICSKMFRERAKLRDHMETHRSDIRFGCKYEHCPHSCLTEASLAEHLEAHRDYKYLCTINRKHRVCRYQTNVKQRYDAHIRRCHPSFPSER